MGLIKHIRNVLRGEMECFLCDCGKGTCKTRDMTKLIIKTNGEDVVRYVCERKLVDFINLQRMNGLKGHGKSNE